MHKDLIYLGLLSHCYQEFQFVRDFTLEIIDKPNNEQHKWYRKWCEHNGIPTILPLHPGSVLMINMAVFLISQQNWFSIFPKTPHSKLDEKWGLSNAEIQCDEHHDPDLRYILQKIRNALAHSDFLPEIPLEATTGIEFRDLMKKSSFTLEDKQKEGRHFQIKISFYDLAKLNSETYMTIKNHLVKKHELKL